MMWCALLVGLALSIVAIATLLLVPSATRDRPYETDRYLEERENRHDE